MPHAYRCRLPAEPSSAAAARRQLETLSWTLEPDESGILALLVTELIANSVQHADTAADADVELDVSVSDEVVRVRVTDGGAGFVAPFRTGDSPLNSHWGLYLLDELADRWETRATPSTVVSFELDRPAAPTTAPGPEPDEEKLTRALSEQARLAEAYQRAIGTSAEFSTYARLQAAGREVSAIDAAVKTSPPD